MITANDSYMDMNDIETIAIIGLACRFPGANNKNQFWENLRDGVESIIRFTDDELRANGVSPEVINDPNYVKAGTVLEGIKDFDAHFFGYVPKEAEFIDPQQRIFLETAWEALEDAGYNPKNFDGHIGVFAGATPNRYADRLYYDVKRNNVARSFQIFIGNERDFLSTRVSHKLDLKGTSLTVQTACSSSLVAVVLACQSLLNYQCSMTLAGGVSINFDDNYGYYYQEGTIVSADGYCRAFDAEANGTIISQGVGVVVLKRLSDAIKDGDTIHAVIKGVATNNDGGQKAGYASPSIDGQAEVIRMAIELSGIDVESIGYIETHGTGTLLGDPVEIAALTQAFRNYTSKNGFCRIGSVKTNIGHADAAAGIAGLIKTVLSLENKQIPPSLYFKKPNPKIDFNNSPFQVNTKLHEWESNGIPRRAGVSSFGIGGTNSHVILEEAPNFNPSGKSRSSQLILLSAKTETALKKVTTNLVEYLKSFAQFNLADVAFTLNTGREEFEYRRMLVCPDLKTFLAKMETEEPSKLLTDFRYTKIQDIVFMFPGQGSQYVNMGLELYHHEKKFKEHIDKCSEILESHLSLDLRTILYPKKNDIKDAQEKLNQTYITQPALFTIEYAIAQLWMSWGISPTSLIGHSLGEFVAACLSGIFTLEDALALVATRAQLIQKLPSGLMLSVSIPEEKIHRFLDDEISIAAINSVSSCVISGNHDSVSNVEKRLQEENINTRRLHTSHAFHSKMMDPILNQFAEKVKQTKIHQPNIPILSTITGSWVTSEEITDPHYWIRNLRDTVRFADCARELTAQPERVLLEAGPGNTLITLTRKFSQNVKQPVLLSSIKHPNESFSDVDFILNSLGKLWLSGIQIDWSGFYRDEIRHRVPLPSYPFERQRCWVEFKQEQVSSKSSKWDESNRLNMNEWFYIPSWKREKMLKFHNRETFVNQKQNFLIFIDECQFGSKLVDRLIEQGQHLTIVSTGKEFKRMSDTAYIVNPLIKEDYYHLLNDLLETHRFPNIIVHLWTLTREDEHSSGRDCLIHNQNLGFNSILFLLQSIGNCLYSDPVKIVMISNHLVEVTGSETLVPEKAMILGLFRVAPKEYSNIKCSIVDIELPEQGSQREKELTEPLLDHIADEPQDSVIAYRGTYRWIQTFKAIHLDETSQTNHRVRQNGVYVITGGFGGIGLVLAEHLANTAHPKLVLIDRTSMPEKNNWESWIEMHDAQDEISQKIRKVQYIEKLGAEVLPLGADVADMGQMEAAFKKINNKYGNINGVIHAAGIPGEGLIQLKTIAAAEHVLKPKVLGTIVLGQLLENTELDFFILCSSIESLIGNAGQVDYCAANAFLDAYAHQNRSTKHVQSINWYAWKEVGMAVNTMVSGNLKQERKEVIEYGISPQEGKKIFDRILDSYLPQVIISTQDFSYLLEQNKRYSMLVTKTMNDEKTQSDSKQTRPNLSSVYVVPSNPTETNIAKIWQELLGIEKIGIHDNFFELGGDSLLATQLITRLRESFPVPLPMTSVFERPTVHLLSKLVLKLNDDENIFRDSEDRAQKRKARKIKSISNNSGE